MLTDFQKDIVAECMKKERGCMCLPMGAGKTLISLKIIQSIRFVVPALVICSKTLISNWVNEIHKFYGSSINYVVYHPEYLSADFQEFTPEVGTDVIITTPEVVSGVYKRLNIKQLFISKEEEEILNEDMHKTTIVMNRFHVPKRAMLPLNHPIPCSFIYSLPWKCVMIDESQQYTNVDTIKCQALACVYSRCIRFLLSGTPINEPQYSRILGFHLLMGDHKFPNSKRDAKEYVRNGYPGMINYMVIRYPHEMDFSIPEHQEIIIAHDLSEDEEKLYASLRTVLKRIVIDQSSKNSARVLATITYLRQFLVCPLIPCRNLIFCTPGVVSRYYKKIVKRMDLRELFKKPSCCSSRIIEIAKVLDRHCNDRCIVFNCFRSNSKGVMTYLDRIRNERLKFTLKSEHSIHERIEIIKSFENTSNGILFLTYQLGAEGLNLQSSHIALLSDPLWNVGRTDQAIARIVRRGQTANAFIYLFTSNTGLEQAIFKKHIDKNKIVKRLFHGCVSNSSIHQLNIKEVVKLILKTEVTGLLKESRDKCT